MKSSYATKSCVLILLVALLCAERGRPFKYPVLCGCWTATMASLSFELDSGKFSALSCFNTHGSGISSAGVGWDRGWSATNALGVPLETSCHTTTCPYTDGFCVAQEIEVVVDSQRRKAKNNLCFPICPTNLENIEILGTTINVTTSCCKKDLCNAAVPTGGSTWTMAGVLLFSLGSVLLQIFL